jgi:hypothetical protein
MAVGSRQARRRAGRTLLPPPARVESDIGGIGSLLDEAPENLQSTNPNDGALPATANMPANHLPLSRVLSSSPQASREPTSQRATTSHEHRPNHKRSSGLPKVLVRSFCPCNPRTPNCASSANYFLRPFDKLKGNLNHSPNQLIFSRQSRGRFSHAPECGLAPTVSFSKDPHVNSRT